MAGITNLRQKQGNYHDWLFQETIEFKTYVNSTEQVSEDGSKIEDSIMNRFTL